MTLTAVTTGRFSEENIKLTIAEPERVADLWLQPGDILIERSNTPELVGIARLFNGPPRFAVFPDLVIRARVCANASAEYVDCVLRSERSRRYFKQVAQGIAGTMPKIDQTAIERLSIPLAPFEEQRRIAEEVERRVSIIDQLEVTVTANLKRAEHLRQAVLKRAFEGKLVPQDPADEPASVLLERIRAEREAAGTGGKKRRSSQQKPRKPESADGASTRRQASPEPTRLQPKAPEPGPRRSAPASQMRLPWDRDPEPEV